MKTLKFIFYCLQNGSLRSIPVNFEEARRKAIHELKIPLPISPSAQKGFFSKLKAIKFKSTTSFNIISNISYVLNSGRMNSMLFISNEKQLVYARILKVASTSTLASLFPLIDKQLESVPLNDEQIDALAFYYVKNELPESASNYKKFAVIRNPFHRLVSVYLDLFDSASPFTYGTFCFGVLKPRMTFKEVVCAIEKIPDFLKGPHFASQYYILSQSLKIENLSWFRLEKDKQGLESFLTGYGITLSTRNKQKEPYDFRSFYDGETLNKVYSLYQQDIVYFDYQKDYKELREFLINSGKPESVIQVS